MKLGEEQLELKWQGEQQGEQGSANTTYLKQGASEERVHDQALIQAIRADSHLEQQEDKENHDAPIDLLQCRVWF